MGLTLIEQIQVEASSTYDDAKDVSTRANAEDSAYNTDVLDNFNYLRTMLKEVKGESDWFAAPAISLNTINGKTFLDDKMMNRSVQMLTAITVTAAQNYETLVQASSETPSRPISLTGTQVGAICAELTGDVGVGHSLLEVAGANALNPKNLCRVIDATTKDAILSGGKEIMALLQVENGATDGGAFNDSTNQAQLSFVIESGSDLIACPVADIQGKSINYDYGDRIIMKDADEQDFNSRKKFTDQAAGVDVTLDNAIDNQSGAATQNQDIDVRITDTYEWQFSDSAGLGILTTKAASGGDGVEVGDGSNAAYFKGFGTGEFVSSLTVDTGTQTINIGGTTGQIDSTALVVKSTTGNLTLDGAGGELVFSDSRLSDIEFTDATYNTLPGGATSIVGALNLAYNSGGITRKDTNTTGAISADTLITSATNLAAALLDYWRTDAATTKTFFTTNVLIWINGVYMRPGEDAAANHDVYASAVEAEANLGAFYSERTIKNGANIMMVII